MCSEDQSESYEYNAMRDVEVVQQEISRDGSPASLEMVNLQRTKYLSNKRGSEESPKHEPALTLPNQNWMEAKVENKNADAEVKQKEKFRLTQKVWAQNRSDRWRQAVIVNENKKEESYSVIFSDGSRMRSVPADLIQGHRKTRQERSDSEDELMDESLYEIRFESQEVALQMGNVRNWRVGAICQVKDEDISCVGGSPWFVGRVDRIVRQKGTLWLKVLWKNVFHWGPATRMLQADYLNEEGPLVKAIEGKVFFKLFGRNTPAPFLASPMLTSRFFEFQWLTTESRRRIPTVLFTPHSGQARFTILFSHGNGCDMGIMRDHWFNLANDLNVNVFGYDYYGYGISNGDCSVRQTLLDIKTVWRYITETLVIPSENIVLYGQSLGSGPTCYLARSLWMEGVEVGGIILHSAFLSLFRVTEPCRTSFWFDIYINVDELKGISTPMLLIHGRADKIIPCKHVEIMQKTLKAHLPHRKRYLINLALFDGNHNNIETHCRDDYIHELSEFLRCKVQDDKDLSNDSQRIRSTGRRTIDL